MLAEYEQSAQKSTNFNSATRKHNPDFNLIFVLVAAWVRPAMMVVGWQWRRG
jgi:hypothetical protein